MAVSREQALRLATHIVDEMATRNGIPMVVSEVEVSEDWCWVFAFQSEEYVATGDTSTMLAGNGPLIVEKNTGKVHHAGTAQPLSVYLADLRRTLAHA